MAGSRRKPPVSLTKVLRTFHSRTWDDPAFVVPSSFRLNAPFPESIKEVLGHAEYLERRKGAKDSWSVAGDRRKGDERRKQKAGQMGLVAKNKPAFSVPATAFEKMGAPKPTVRSSKCGVVMLRDRRVSSRRKQPDRRK